MTDQSCEKYQLAGVDNRERGFNRTVELRRDSNAYRATLYYEKIQVRGEAADNSVAALHSLVHRLHASGYSQLRTRLSFRGEDYLGSEEPWIEYPDPAHPPFRARLGDFFRNLIAGFTR